MDQTTASGFGHVEAMLRLHPAGPPADLSKLVECITACFDCEQTCIACADACLAEKIVIELIRCIRLNQDCANLCEATGKLLSRQTFTDASLRQATLQACILACRVCGEECTRLAPRMKHCGVTAEACKRCESACQAMLVPV